MRGAILYDPGDLRFEERETQAHVLAPQLSESRRARQILSTDDRRPG
jgi:hypothetical protein